MGFSWTEEQQAVIDARGHSVLVSAAAGSGKTAVLVERLIRELTDEVNPIDIERLLVVTFTNAAAAEMRERISKGLEKCLKNNPGNTRWQKQKILLPYAQISTIHSLCLKLIREHFDILDIDPSFRLGDEAELKLLKSDVADDVMEVYYASENHAFREFVDRYANGKTDAGITDMVIRLYDYSRGFPWPEYWLEQCCDMYSDCRWNNQEVHPILAFSICQLQGTLMKLEPMLDEAERMCKMPDGPEAYLTIIDSDREWVHKLKTAENYEDARSILNAIQWKRLPRTSSSVDPVLKEAVKDLHTLIKSDISSLSEVYFAEAESSIRQEMAYIRPSITMLTDLVRSFSERYAAEKLDRNMLDFSDLEHYALNLLVAFEKDTDGNMLVIPTSVADELSNFYSEIVCDEYQDSNQVQEMILDVLSGERFGRYNRFMVGDVKQSIYRFRLADSAIFMDKYNKFAPFREGGNRVRIDLHQNFRSRAYVLESINFFFRKIMRESLGGIDYDDQAALYPGIEYPENAEANIATQTELLLISADQEMSEEDKEEFSSIAIEAKAIAAEIRELVDDETGMDVYDSDQGIYRRAEYKDIVVLLRTVSGWAEEFMEIFTQEDIPVTAEMTAGFFDTIEIRTMIEFLTVIDNPRQDIPLAAVLCSPIVGLNSEDLAMVKCQSTEGDLYTACLSCPEALDAYSRIQRFLLMLNDIREASKYMEIYELLQYIYDQTGYYDYVQALPGGQRRKANLELLIDRAVAYSSGSFSGLFNFVRYIEQLKKNNIELGEAALPEDGKGRVRIISIHKSKGLEYPIVILAGLGKKINFKDSVGSMVLHSEYGIGLDAVNLNNRKKIASVYKRYIGKQLNRETLAEELRILYVALTRAKEKLIMTGLTGAKDIQAQLKSWKNRVDDRAEVLEDWVLADAKSYLDWIMPCIVNNDSPLVKLRMIDVRELIGREVLRTMEERYQKDMLIGRESEKYTSTIGRALQADEDWEYPEQSILSIKGKYSVSELKKAEMDADDTPIVFNRMPVLSSVDEEEIPDFMKDEDQADESIEEIKITGGAFRGTAYHRVLELLSFAQCPERVSTQWVEGQIKIMTENNKISEIQAKRINLFDIRSFAASELGQRMAAADRKQRLKREVQFVMGVPISMVHSGIDSDRSVVVQGVIDAWFEEPEGIILVDYKTDQVPKNGGEDILCQRYDRQLDYYQYALEQMTGKKVVERLIYSFSLGKAILVNN